MTKEATERTKVAWLPAWYFCDFVTEMDLNLSRCLAEMDSVSWDDLTFGFPCLHRTHPLSADSITDLRPSQEDWLGSPPCQTSL
jgi:hypothetical protein